jgi:hypothetical protein
MCGYQGWFNAPGDGSQRGWVHWSNGNMEPGRATVDLWPDVAELGADERFPTGFRYSDGRVADVFSSYNAKTVARHFQWMQDYGIDGVFLQRFANGIGNPVIMDHYQKVLQNVRDGASQHGRVFGLMYDLSGTRTGDVQKVIDDWKHLFDQNHLTGDRRYIHQDGKPVVAVWGLGFNDKRDPLLSDGLRLVRFLKSDPIYGGNMVLIGVPARWRTDDTASVPLAEFRKVLVAADIIQPWSVGTCRTLDEVTQSESQLWADDMEWCRANHKLYMPVVYPGFSWHNLRKGQTPSDQIPRLGGRFLWAQYSVAKKLDVRMVYQAMFDEVDEGTAIFKCDSNAVPDGQGKSRFLSYGGLPSDFYLQLVGEATRLIRGEMAVNDEKLIKHSPQ